MFNLEQDMMSKIKNALEAHDIDAFSKSVAELARSEAGAAMNVDAEILAGRGVRQLTSEEKAFYNALITAQKAGTVKQSISDMDIVLPETVIDEVFTDIEQAHPLLSKLDIKRVSAKIKVIYTTADTNTATWGKLTDKITDEASFGFEELDAGLLKLSAYIPVPKAYLDLGPTFLDTLTRTYLYEAIARKLEDGVINNLDTATGPVGMMADLTTGSAVDGADTTYTAKTATTVTAWTPKGLSKVLAKMAKTRKGNDRPLAGLFLVVNPSDYYNIVKPAVCVQNGSGDWVDRQPYPIEIVQSAAMASGKAVLGMQNEFVLGVASDKKGVIESSDDYQFLDDNRVYKIKLYANGRPKDNNAFQVLDISGLKEAALFVKAAE